MSCSCKAWESLITSVPSRWRRRPRRPCLRSISGLSARTPNVLVQVSGGEGMPGGGGGGGGGICVVGPAWRIELGGSEAWDVQLQHVAHDPAEDGVPLLDAALPEHASTEPSLNRRSSALEPHAEHGGASCKPGPLSTSRRASGCLSRSPTSTCCCFPYSAYINGPVSGHNRNVRRPVE